MLCVVDVKVRLCISDQKLEVANWFATFFYLKQTVSTICKVLMLLVSPYAHDYHLSDSQEKSLQIVEKGFTIF